MNTVDPNSIILKLFQRYIVIHFLSSWMKKNKLF